MIDLINQYFNNTSVEQMRRDWEAIEPTDNDGPLISDLIQFWHEEPLDCHSFVKPTSSPPNIIFQDIEKDSEFPGSFLFLAYGKRKFTC